jgi:hypothetical protein
MSLEASALKGLADKIDAKIDDFLEQSKDRDHHRDKMLEGIHLAVFGDGNGNPGLRLRTDRLEHKHESLRKDFDEKQDIKKSHVATIWAAILAAIGTAVASFFSKQP